MHMSALKAVLRGLGATSSHPQPTRPTVLRTRDVELLRPCGSEGVTRINTAVIGEVCPFFFFLLGGATPEVFRIYSWQCSEDYSGAEI